MSIYVEIRIRGRLENVWEHSQDPALHERWDLRFSEITYLPRRDNEPQRFHYETRLGFGLRIRGVGESAGSRDGISGDRTSALKFWSDDPKSPIREGSGYWQYERTADGTRFLTWYDYRTRFGPLGKLIDRLVFRPLMGWATAWSFDRLRLWIEKGVDPGLSMQRSLVHAIARVALAIVFLYQGLLPKLIYRHASELSMLSDAGLGPGSGCIHVSVALLRRGGRVRMVRRRHESVSHRGQRQQSPVGASLRLPGYVRCGMAAHGAWDSSGWHPAPPRGAPRVSACVNGRDTSVAPVHGDRSTHPVPRG